ncbi:MAG: lytic transglycosylase domain-containing protein [Betaproteobacteria bacterium]|nr:lytic transglycosylase domain-containing protein [Betaproteobacteria bacterium]
MISLKCCFTSSLLIGLAVTAQTRPARADVDGCVKQAALRYQVDERLINAIIQVESSGNSSAFNRNANGSEDIGLMQINSSWVPVLGRYGIKRHHLYDPCTNIHVGAWVLAGNIARYGRTWRAVGAFNAKSRPKQERYAAKIWRRYMTQAGSES